jgi:glycosyltransferase involved in cell wall biosynthesis
VTDPTAVTPPASRNDPCPCGSGKRYKNCHGLPVGVLGDANSIAVARPAWQTSAEQGLAAQQRGDYAAAEQWYRESLRENADNPDVLHMLGVVRTQRYDPEDGLRLIIDAADRINWSLPNFRHNVGYTLSAFLSSRPAKSLQSRVAAVNEARSRRSNEYANAVASRAATVGVLLICSDAATALTAVENIAQQTRMLDELSVAALPEAIDTIATLVKERFPDRSSVVLPRTDNVISDALATAREMKSDWVQLSLADVSYRPTRLSVMLTEVALSGARWGFSLASPAIDSAESNTEHALLALLNGLKRLLPRPRLGDLFIDRLGFAITPSNLFFERALLVDVLGDPVLTEFSATGLCLNALWRDEPFAVIESTFDISTAKLDRLYNELLVPSALQQVDRAVNRMLEGARPPNPAAPNAIDDGPDFLKRSLRGGIGAKLSAATLKRIVAMTQNMLPDEPLIDGGIEFVGFARAESGLGENLRSLVRATQTTDIPVSVTDVDIDSGIRNSDNTVSALIDVARYKTRVICVNPDLLGEAFRDDGFARARHAYRIGFWFWELERLPRNWADTAHLVDEIWVATQFVADAVRRDVFDRPVHKIHTPVQRPQLSRTYSRAEFGLRQDACLFLFSFAYGSFASRKNPEAVIRAFRAAFPIGTEDAQLVIKSSQSDLFPKLKQQLHDLTRGDPRIIFLDTYLSRDAVYGLQSCCDAYVSLHRSEGLGLGLAECMAQGKPVIATNYSGNLEFMNDKNSFLVDYRLIPVRQNEYADWKDQVWADADFEHAAYYMRKIFDDTSLASRLGRRAADDMAERFSYRTIGSEIMHRFSNLLAAT